MKAITTHSSQKSTLLSPTTSHTHAGHVRGNLFSPALMKHRLQCMPQLT